jgi:hypothetical protein
MSGPLAAIVGGRSFAPLAVVASNVSRSQQGFSPSGTVTTTQSPNTTITGGVAPYTQEWTRLTGSTTFISDDTALNPTWSATVNDGEPVVETWRVTVTDTAASTATFDITITLTWVQI